MTSTPSSAAARRFYPLEQADFLKLEQAASLKGLLQPFKGKGTLTQWANQCHRLRDELIELGKEFEDLMERLEKGGHSLEAAKRFLAEEELWKTTIELAAL